MDSQTTPNKKAHSFKWQYLVLLFIILFVLGGMLVAFLVFRTVTKNLSGAGDGNLTEFVSNQINQMTDGTELTPTQTLTHLDITREEIIAAAKEEGYTITFEPLLTGSIESYSAVFDDNTLVVTEDQDGIFSVALTSTGEPNIDADFMQTLATRIDPDINADQWLEQQLNEVVASTDSLDVDNISKGKAYNVSSTVIVYDDGSVYQKQVMVSINGSVNGQ